MFVQSDVDTAYDAFWNSYFEIYNRTFALKRRRFNKNIKQQNFMTRGLLVLQNTIKTVHKNSISSPSAENIAKYKNFKTIYQRVIRAAKKLYFTSKLESCSARDWERSGLLGGIPRVVVQISALL